MVELGDYLQNFKLHLHHGEKKIDDADPGGVASPLALHENLELWWRIDFLLQVDRSSTNFSGLADTGKSTKKKCANARLSYSCFNVLQNALAMSKPGSWMAVRYFPQCCSWASPRWRRHVSAFVVMQCSVVCSRKCIPSSAAPGSDGELSNGRALLFEMDRLWHKHTQSECLIQYVSAGLLRGRFLYEHFGEKPIHHGAGTWSSYVLLVERAQKALRPNGHTSAASIGDGGRVNPSCC